MPKKPWLLFYEKIYCTKWVTTSLKYIKIRSTNLGSKTNLNDTLLNNFELPNAREINQYTILSKYVGRAYVKDEGGEGEPDGKQGQGGERAVNPQT